jgi:hypothetical protein
MRLRPTQAPKRADFRRRLSCFLIMGAAYPKGIRRGHSDIWCDRGQMKGQRLRDSMAHQIAVFTEMRPLSFFFSFLGTFRDGYVGRP